MAVFISKMNTSSPVHTKTKICNKHFNLNDRLLKSLFRTTGTFECHQCTINFSLIYSNLFSIKLQQKKKNKQQHFDSMVLITCPQLLLLYKTTTWWHSRTEYFAKRYFTCSLIKTILKSEQLFENMQIPFVFLSSP